MAKLIDFLVSRVLVFALTFIICSLFLNNLWLSLLVSIFATFIVAFASRLIKGKIKDTRCTVENFTKYCVIHGNIYVYGLLCKIFSPDSLKQQNDNFLCIKHSEKDEMVISALKFGNISPDEILKYFNLATKNACEHIHLISRGIDRKSISLANSFNGVKFSYISARQLFKIIKSHNLLPEIKPQKVSVKKSVKTILSVAFARKNLKHYLFTSVILLLMSFITPLKVYYLSIAGIAFVLAILCLTNISLYKNNNSHELFEPVKKNSK